MRHSLVARVAVYNYVDLVHPAIDVPDPTEKLVSKIRDFVEAHGAKLVVGMQASDDKLVAHLRPSNSALSFDGAEAYTGRSGAHWTPNGQKLVRRPAVRPAVWKPMDLAGRRGQRSRRGAALPSRLPLGAR